MMVLTDTHKECNRQAGLNFLGVRPVLDLVASEEKFRGYGRDPPHPYPIYIHVPYNRQAFGMGDFNRRLKFAELRIVWHS
jgi:hypothetical protein